MAVVSKGKEDREKIPRFFQQYGIPKIPYYSKRDSMTKITEFQRN